MKLPDDFPLKGKELKPVILKLHKLFTKAVKDYGGEYKNYIEKHGALQEYFSKLIKYLQERSRE